MKKSRREGARHDISDCAYLFPKELLLPPNEAAIRDGTNPVSVVNSAGVSDSVMHPECKKVLDTADYVAFRDLPPGKTNARFTRAISRPDSAVMTDVLFRDLIVEYGDKGEVATVRHLAENGYLAIQFKQSVGNPNQIALVLDAIHHHTKLTTVFFQVGSAPGHDSLKTLQNVAAQMTTPTYIFATEHVWSVVALIRYSSAVISTSLHVRIMAFVHARPRVTVCNPNTGKHTAFIQIWESEDATPCSTKFDSSLWKFLEKSLATSPNATFTAQKRAVDSYMEGFEQWSRMLQEAG